MWRGLTLSGLELLAVWRGRARRGDTVEHGAARRAPLQSAVEPSRGAAARAVGPFAIGEIGAAARRAVQQRDAVRWVGVHDACRCDSVAAIAGRRRSEGRQARTAIAMQTHRAGRRRRPRAWRAV